MSRYRRGTWCLVSTLAVCLAVILVSSALEAEDRPRAEFTRMIAHWDAYGDREAYLAFVDESQPEVAQVGFYGAHFWSLAPTPFGKGYPAHFPVQGLQECGDWFTDLNRELHRRHVKVVGHMNVKFLVGDPDSDEGPRGFFKFYRELWDEEKLGPKPVADPLSLLEIDAKGAPIASNSYSIGGMKEYWGCLNNPHWRTVLKVWTKQAIDRGVDGLIANYFYRHNCLCEHCQKEFRGYLGDRFTPEELRDKFDIQDLKTHAFPEIVSWHSPAETTPFRREQLRFSQIANKRAFDEVFIEYGRSLKPDLMVAQWNHLGNFSQINGDERCLLPVELWGKGEDYLWYSTGSSAFYTDLAERFLGEGTLQARFIRGIFHDKPFTLGKYESTRTRSAIAELAANGGAPMGFYTRFTDPEARQEIARYYGFLKRYQDLFQASSSHAEALLLFPRKAVLAGDLNPLQTFRDQGTQLLDAHVLFDILPDDAVTPEQLEKYRQVFSTAVPEVKPEAALLSTFDAPYTVRVCLSRPASGSGLTLHLVNYNREEPPRGADGKPSAGGGIKDEKPIAVSGIKANLVLPAGFTPGKVDLVTPEKPDAQSLPFEVKEGRLHFSVPEFLVYGVIHMQAQ